MRGIRAHLTRRLVADLARRFAEVEDGHLVPDPPEQDLAVLAARLVAAIQESARSAATPDVEGPGYRQAKSVRSVLRTDERMTATDDRGRQPMTPATIKDEERQNDGR